MRISSVLQVAVLITGISTVSQASVVTFDDGRAWGRAAYEVGDSRYRVVEDFNDGDVDGVVREAFGGTLGPVVNEFDPFFSVETVNGGISAMQWSDLVFPTEGFGTRWSFAVPVVAWGGVWDLFTDRDTLGLTWTLFSGGSEIWSGTLVSDYSGFAGVVSSHPFDSVLLTANDQGGTGPNTSRQFYDLDNMVAQVSVIPVPAPLLLLLSGVASIAFASKYRRRSTAG